MQKHIPNFFTSLNLLSGCIAIVFAFEGRLELASLFIGTGAFFDFIDGFAARLLKVKSNIGKQLDSLADVVTFGLVPGFIIFQLIRLDMDVPGPHISSYPAMAYLAFLIPVFAALRLAKFNIDPRQEEIFYGLPTPAAAIFIGSFPLVLMQQKGAFGISMEGIHALLTSVYFLVSVSVLVSWLMISDIGLFSLKFRSAGWQANRMRYLFLIMSVILLLVFHFVAIPVIIALYVILSLSVNTHS